MEGDQCLPMTSSYLVVDPHGVLQEPVLLLLHPVRLKRLLTDFTRLQRKRKHGSESESFGFLFRVDPRAQSWTRLSHLVFGCFDDLKLLLLRRRLALLHLLLVLLLEELTLRSLLQVSDLLELDPVLNNTENTLISRTTPPSSTSMTSTMCSSPSGCSTSAGA